ncbi:MAG: DUF61 family protein [Acidilobaceae archaeon]|nr:DUF61 family protein [Acidilobaceae archaeon]MCX8166155.1 DUF61 family protein [Acidilobaceae archaeon]MDW7974793.1 DUF61 family protein [Sulfolobales archaeon]
MSEEKLGEYLQRKFREEARRLAALLPAESLTLMELSRGKREVRLNSGELHALREEEVRALLSSVPPFLWLNCRVPLLLRYRREEDGRSLYLVEGGIWQRRLAEIMLSNNLTAEGKGELSPEEFRHLLGKYGSLVFVTLEASGEGGAEI